MCDVFSIWILDVNHQPEKEFNCFKHLGINFYIPFVYYKLNNHVVSDFAASFIFADEV